MHHKIDISPHQRLFHTLTIGSRIFKVPPFQREYAWAKNQVSDFFSDMNKLVQLRLSELVHPFGDLVFMEAGTMDAGGLGNFEVLEVVDGQQRLTTYALCVAALLQRMKAIEPLVEGQTLVATEGFTATIQQMQLCLFLNGNPKGQPVLQLQRHSQLSFESILRQGEAEAVHGNQKVIDAWNFFVTQFENFDAQSCLNFSYVLLRRLLVISITTRSHHDATVMFELINARGKGLTDLELLKNCLMSFLYKHVGRGRQPGLIDKVNDVWSTLLSIITEFSLDEADENDILLSLATVEAGVFIQAAEGTLHGCYEVVRGMFFLDTDPKNAEKYVEQFLTRLLASCRAVAFFKTGRAAIPCLDFVFADDRILYLIRWAQVSVNSVVKGAGGMFDMGVVYPCLAAFFLLYNTSVKDMNSCILDLFRVLDVLEQRLFRVALVRGRGIGKARNYKLKELARAAKGIADGCDFKLFQQKRARLHDELNRLSQSLNRIFPDSEMQKFILSDESMVKWEGTPHVLLQYEREFDQFKADFACMKDLGLDVVASLTKEHICPKRGKEAEWGDALRDVEEIGNLTLLPRSDNSEAGTTKDAKRRVFAASRCGTVKILEGKVDSWSRVAILERTTELKNFTWSRWRADAPNKSFDMLQRLCGLALPVQLQEADDVCEENPSPLKQGVRRPRTEAEDEQLPGAVSGNNGNNGNNGNSAHRPSSDDCVRCLAVLTKGELSFKKMRDGLYEPQKTTKKGPSKPKVAFHEVLRAMHASECCDDSWKDIEVSFNGETFSLYDACMKLFVTDVEQAIIRSNADEAGIRYDNNPPK